MIALFQSYFIYSGLPSNITINWNYGSLLGIILAMQIVSGVSLGMHYTANIDLAFLSVEYIMRSVQYGWLIRYLHSNGASLFFLFVYLHIARGLYAGSYSWPRAKLWNIGVIIYFLMTATAFLGYVLPYGQMSIWGDCPTCIIQELYMEFSIFGTINRATKRIGPHNIDIISIIFGSLLGDANAEKRGHGTRINFYQESTHKGYILWLHQLISNLGYSKLSIPIITTRLGIHGKLRNILRFKTYTFSSFNWIYDSFYINNKKCLPHFNLVFQFLTPLALAIWIMDDGSISSTGMKIATNNFTLKEVETLVTILNIKYNLSTSVNSASVPNQYVIYIPKKNVNYLYDIVGLYIHPSMKYKFHI